MSKPAIRTKGFEELYAELVALPRHQVGEIVNGRLHVSPRPKGAHGLVASVLGIDIGGAYHRGRGGPGGWWILDEPELHLLGQVLVPDLAGWRRERMPQMPADHRFVVSPDWVCEVLSPSTAKLDRIEKMPLYLQMGVVHLWLVDPTTRTLEAYQRQDAHWILLSAHQDDAIVCVPPFDVIQLELAALWEGAQSQGP